MHTIQRFRRTLRRRLIHAAAPAMIAASALCGVACGGKVVVDGEPAGGDGGGGNGGAGGAAGVGAGLPYVTGSGTGSGTGCALTSTGSMGTDYQITECINEVNGKCPNQYQATMYIVPSLPCSYVVSVDCGPVIQGDVCCYLVTEQGAACP